MPVRFTYHPEGFWKESIYSSYYHSLLSEYTDRIKKEVFLELQLVESIYDSHTASKIEIVEEGQKIIVKVVGHRYVKGSTLTAPPSPTEAFQDIRFWLERAMRKFQDFDERNV